MKKLFIATLMMCLSWNVFADTFTPYYKYRVYLKDKKQSEYSVRHPEAFLSDKAISGDSSWKKITPPSDAKDVLTAGAINPRGILASFSSIGNTTDNRIKPDVVTRGQYAICFSENGGIGGVNGTSFSSPILTGMVACLWQALPDLTAYEIMDIVRKSGDRANCPDNIYGYGIPDFYKAYTIGIVRSKKYK